MAVRDDSGGVSVRDGAVAETIRDSGDLGRAIGERVEGLRRARRGEDQSTGRAHGDMSASIRAEALGIEPQPQEMKADKSCNLQGGS